MLELPGGLDSPWLVEDENFDVSNHVHRAAVPAPGGISEVAELASSLFGGTMNRSRPLWEVWIIEGVADGRIAMLMKTHHCLADGSAGMGLIEILCDQVGGVGPERVRRKPEATPSGFEISLSMARNLAVRPVAFTRLASRAFEQARKSWSSPAENRHPSSVPRVIFNHVRSGSRAFAFGSLPLAAVKKAKNIHGTTVNDVLLAVTGTAVRNYLLERRELRQEMNGNRVPSSASEPPTG